MQQGLASLEKALGHGFGILSRFNGSRYVCCAEEQEIMFRELCFGVSDIKSGRILGANKIDQGRLPRHVTSKVAQDSVLGPTFDLMSCCRCLEILNNLIFELVLCK